MTEIITFTGVQGSGKTTMRRKLVDHLREKGYDVMSQYVGINESISRDAALLGFTLNEKTDFNTQYYLAAKYIVVDLETRIKAESEEVDYIVVDRSPLDVIPYSENASYSLYQKKLIRDWEKLPPDEAIERSIEVFGETYRTDEPKRLMRRFLNRPRS